MTISVHRWTCFSLQSRFSSILATETFNSLIWTPYILVISLVNHKIRIMLSYYRCHYYSLGTVALHIWRSKCINERVWASKLTMHRFVQQKCYKYLFEHHIYRLTVWWIIGLESCCNTITVPIITRYVKFWFAVVLFNKYILITNQLLSISSCFELSSS